MNYFKLWRQAENRLIFNESIDLMEQIKKVNHISFARVKIKSWDELYALYGQTNIDNYIYIREDATHFQSGMKEFCGQEFEIAIDSTDRILFSIMNEGLYWGISKHMVDIIESNGFEINQNYPIIKICASTTLANMWDDLYNHCKNSEQKILDNIMQIALESTRKMVRIKTWDELAAKYSIVDNGIMIYKDGMLFHNDMRSLCGQEFIAKYQDDSCNLGNLESWIITKSMVTEI